MALMNLPRFQEISIQDLIASVRALPGGTKVRSVVQTSPIDQTKFAVPNIVPSGGLHRLVAIKISG